MISEQYLEAAGTSPRVGDFVQYGDGGKISVVERVDDEYAHLEDGSMLKLFCFSRGGYDSRILKRCSSALPIPGVLEEEVPGEVRLGALAELKATHYASQANALQSAVHEKAQENFKRFLQHMMALDPHLTPQLGSQLVRASAPARYQAWGKLVNTHVPLWSSPSCGGDLARAHVDFCAGADRIELIDRIGIVPDNLAVGDEVLLREDNGVELRAHTLTSENTTHLPWRLLTAERGMRLIGARRPIVLPRASVPHLRLRGKPSGWIFVEGWRLTLR